MAIDGIELLIFDHREMEKLFTAVQDGCEGKEEVVDQIIRHLSVHDFVEREELYPLVHRAVPHVGEALSKECLDDHREVAKLLLKIEAEDPSGRDALMTKVIADVRSNVEIEEKQVFPKLRESLSEADLDKLAHKIGSARMRAPTLPHPHTPTGLAGRVVGAAETVVDSIHNTFGAGHVDPT